jgi:hypothetical protein
MIFVPTQESKLIELLDPKSSWVFLEIGKNQKIEIG